MPKYRIHSKDCVSFSFSTHTHVLAPTSVQQPSVVDVVPASIFGERFGQEKKMEVQNVC